MFALVKNLRKNTKRIAKVTPPLKTGSHELCIEKLGRLISSGYVKNGYVHWDVNLFDVPKWEEDIGLVFDGTSRGVNQVVWAPFLFLPNSKALDKLTHTNTYHMDMDIGEMFHNYPLHEGIQVFCGVNLSAFNKDFKKLSK